MTIRILIVDDEIDLPRTVSDYLEDVCGYETELADTAEDGLEKCASLQPAICIVDMHLPGMDGNEFIQKAHTKVPNCKFIIHTGAMDYVLSDELQEIGVTEDSIIHKPVFNLSDFSDKIKTLLSCSPNR